MLTAESAVEWTAFLRAKDERKANKLITRLQDRLDEPMDVRELARYEEDERLYQCVLITTLEEVTPAEITYRVLTLAFQIGPVWEIWGWWWPPGWPPDFSGKLSDQHIPVTGVEWLGFVVPSGREIPPLDLEGPKPR